MDTQIKLEKAAATTTSSQSQEDIKPFPADHVDTSASSTTQASVVDTVGAAAAASTQAVVSESVHSAAATTTQAAVQDIVVSAVATPTQALVSDTVAISTQAHMPVKAEPFSEGNATVRDTSKMASPGTENLSSTVPNRKTEPSAVAPFAESQMQSEPAATEAAISAAAPVLGVKSEVVDVKKSQAGGTTPPSAADLASLSQSQAVVKQEPMETG